MTIQRNSSTHKLSKPLIVSVGCLFSCSGMLLSSLHVNTYTDYIQFLQILTRLGVVSFPQSFPMNGVFEH